MRNRGKKKRPNPPTKRPSAQPVTRTTTQSISTKLSGPLPSPEVLQGFDQVVPGSAERIIRMAEQDAEHRRVVEASLANTASVTYTRGQWMGFVIAVLGLGTAAFATYIGDTVTASTIGGTTLVGLVAVFVLGRLLDDSD